MLITSTHLPVFRVRVNKGLKKLNNVFKQLWNKVTGKDKGAWGYLLTVDLAGCLPEAVNDKDHLTRWVKDLVEEIDMVADGEPWVKHYDLPTPHLSGNTVFQMITTSNITCHFNDLDNSAFIDVFSCKKFDPRLAIRQMESWLCFKKINWKFTVRTVPV